MQCIQKTHKNRQDVAASLRDLNKKDLGSTMPQRQISQLTGDAKVVKQSGLDVHHEAELKRHLDRVDMLEQNVTKACALTCSTHCTKTLQHRIEEHAILK